jgi:hypothetical protein
MRAALLGCCLVVVGGDAFAHRLDEYLQATRIAVASNRIDVAFDLTPGVAVANQVLELIDQNGDGRISDPENKSYAHRFLKDLKAGLDGKAVALKVFSVSFPSVPEIRNGTGVIQIRAALAVRKLDAGDHFFTLTNGHLPNLSAYLANALRSSNPRVEIGKQTRDELQREYRLEFRVRP